MKKILAFLLITLFSFFTLRTSQADNTFKVLFIGSLSGDVAMLGVSAQNSIRLFLEENKNTKVEVTYEDDQCKPSNTVSIYQRVKALRRPDLVINTGSQTSLALVPVLERDSVPLIAIASDGNISKDKQFAVNLWVTPSEEAKIVTKELKRKKISKTVHLALPSFLIFRQS